MKPRLKYLDTRHMSREQLENYCLGAIALGALVGIVLIWWLA